MAERKSKYRKLTHLVYPCTYHIVFVPKYRFRILTGAVKELVEHDIRVLCQWKDVEVIELSVQADHVHLVCSTEAEGVGFGVHGYAQGEAGHGAIQELPAPQVEALLGGPLLGTGLLCQYRRAR